MRNFPRSVFSAAVLLATLAMTAGCSTPLKKPTSFDFSSFQPSFEKEDFLLYVRDTPSPGASSLNLPEEGAQGDGGTWPGNDISPLPDIAASDERPILFIVSRPEWNAAATVDEEGMENVLFTFRERMYRYLLRNYPHPTKVRYAWLPNDNLLCNYRIIQVDSEITHVTKGSGVVRFMVGYGAGAVTVQYEGTLHEIHPEEEFLAAFALRQNHAAYPNGFLNTEVINDAYCMRYASEAIVSELTTTLPQFLPPPGLPVDSLPHVPAQN